MHYIGQWSVFCASLVITWLQMNSAGGILLLLRLERAIFMLYQLKKLAFKHKAILWASICKGTHTHINPLSHTEVHILPCSLITSQLCIVGFVNRCGFHSVTEKHMSAVSCNMWGSCSGKLPPVELAWSFCDRQIIQRKKTPLTSHLHFICSHH